MKLSGKVSEIEWYVLQLVKETILVELHSADPRKFILAFVGGLLFYL